MEEGRGGLLYPCGSRVKIPSLGLNAAGPRIDERFTRVPSRSFYGGHPLYIASRKKQNFSNVSDVRLTFSDNVVEMFCPETVTYSKACENLRGVVGTGKGIKSRLGVYCKKTRMSNSNRALMHKEEAAASLRLGKGQTPGKHSFKGKKESTDALRFLPILQTVFPKPLSEWTEGALDKTTPTGCGKVLRGKRRWTALPVREPTPTDLQLAAQSIIEDERLLGTPCRKEEESCKEKSQRDQLLHVFHELIVTWKVVVQPKDLSIEAVNSHLLSPCASKQLYGLEIVRQLYENRMGSNGEDMAKREDDVTENCEVWDLVQSLLQAETERVRVASAILLCSLKGDQGTETIHSLLATLISSSSREKWASTQALAIIGICNLEVVKTLFNHVCEACTDSEREKCSRLLSSLSAYSNLVVALLAEKLNSKSWRERLTACSVVALLQHDLNKDVSNRLLDIALHDCNPEVRLVAAQALGKTGNGKLVHDAIKKDLEVNCEAMRLSALRKLHTLRLMTASLLPVFLKSFSDEHNLIRLEAISIAEDLQLVDDDVIAALTPLLQDSCWKVKAHAIRAVGTLRIDSEEVVTHLMWAARFEQLPEVRAQVCHTLSLLRVRDERIVKVLKDLLIVEDEEIVLREAKKSLKALNQDTVAVDEMLETVCAEVKSLSTKEEITKQIIGSEKTEFVEYVLLRPPQKMSTRDYLKSTIR